MALETSSNQEPIKLDLQKPDISKLNLSEEQSKLFSEYLKWKERVDIIHLTQEELLDLKKSLGTSTLDSFIESQAGESYSSDELLPKIEWVEKQKEKLQNLDEASYMYIFKGTNEIFKWQNLSEDAKRNFSTAFSLYLMENLPQGASVDIKNWIKTIESFMQKGVSWNTPPLQPTLWTFFEKLNEKLALLKNITWLALENWWEKNTIFMNPVKGLDFLKNLIPWNDISSTIKASNLKDGEKITISDIDNKRLQEISKKVWPLLKEIPWNKGQDLTISQLKENPDMLETLKKLSESKPFWPVFKLVLTLLWIGDINEAIEWAHYENLKKSFWKIVWEKNLIVSWLKLWNDFMMKGTEKDMSFVWKLRSLSGRGKPDEAFLRNLLSQKWDLNQIISLKWLSIKESENINYKALSEWVSLLVGYNADKAKAENKDLTIQAYLDSLNPQKKEPEYIPLWKTKLHKKQSSESIIITENEKGEIPLKLIQKEWSVTSFEFNWKKYELDINWLPDLWTKKPTITIEWEDLVMKWGYREGRKPLVELYKELSEKWESVIIEDYSVFHDLMLKEVKEKVKTKVADSWSNDSSIDDVFKYG